MEIPTKTQVVVVGAGQAGIAASEHLRSHGICHVVLERNRLAESWMTRRWDSLVANGPAWHDRFPNLKFKGNQNAFATKEEVAEYMQEYANQIEMPVFTQTEVLEVSHQLRGKSGFVVRTTAGHSIDCHYVIAATGTFQTPLVPQLVSEKSEITQMHSINYKSPHQLDEGAVLVVGAGSSGSQIAEEIMQAGGHKTYLSIGPHNRPPRSYRGRDFYWWLGVLNKWDMESTPGSDHTTIAVSGANGGHTIDFRRLVARGVTLLGLTAAYTDGKLEFNDDLSTNVIRGDANYLSVLDEADEYIEKSGLDLPPEPEAREFLANPECMTNPIRTLDLKEAGITTIIWATGFKADYSWLCSTSAIDGATVKPRHTRGISSEPGIYFLGLP